MPSNNHSSMDSAERRRLAYEKRELLRALDIVCAALPSRDWVDDMLNPSEVMALRQQLMAEAERLREIKRKFGRAEVREWTDEEMKKALGFWFEPGV